MMPTCMSVAWNNTSVAEAAKNKFVSLAGQMSEYAEKKIPKVAVSSMNRILYPHLQLSGHLLEGSSDREPSRGYRVA